MVSTCVLSKSSTPFINSLGIFHVYQLQLVSPTSYSIDFFFLKKGLDILHPFGFLLILFFDLPGRLSPLFGQFSFFL